ncbi:hypothetical protein ymoll0001_10160 [Yersinia mollaretii ATCC 43969]|uniref:Uncharacterized protein n=1 Tax=Yersinia mollaretii (strain ATCC 43969 / DSM 18520 / CIP 103324 / CNY 7263 / WAIP 204) TaxID=349967 RepID=A0ABP2EIX5_YERMW|nr:hypothetical protein ymoll0001_10160 [Yersinia mollaretii ATCC 43969]
MLWLKNAIHPASGGRIVMIPQRGQMSALQNMNTAKLTVDAQIIK